MPKFTFTSPEGKTYDVEGPEGATKEQAFGILQQRLGGTQAKPEPTGLEKLPPLTPPGNQQPKNADDIAHRILGIGEAGLSALTGAAGGAAGQLYGIGKTLTGGKYGTQAGIQEGEKAGVELANKLTYQPRTQTGRDILETAGRVGEASRLQGLPVEGPVLARLPEVPRGALATGEGLGAVNRAVGRTAAAPVQAAGRAAVNALPAIDPETAALAREAHSMGFRLTPEQVYGNKYGKFAGELASENPLVKNVKEQNQAVFDQRLVDLVGGEGNKLTRKTFASALNKSGETIGSITGSKDLPITPEAVTSLRSHAAGQLPDVAGVVNHYAGLVESQAKNGQLPGNVFRKINTDLNSRIRGTSNGDLRNALSGFQDDLLERFTPLLSPEELAQYNTARRQYAIGKTLEPLVAKAPTGNIQPSSLLGAVTRTQAGKSAAARGAAGDLGKLADIGQKFLKSQPSSGTAERSFFQNLFTHPAGTLAAGATAAATAPVAAAYNRYAPSVTQQLIERPPQP